MSGGYPVGNGEMSFSDFMRLYAPTALPQARPAPALGLSSLGPSQPQSSYGQSQPQLGFGQQQGQGQGQGQQGGSLPFLGQIAQLGAPSSYGAHPGANPSSNPGGGYGQAQAGQPVGGIQQLLINAMNNNGANGSSNALANAVGYVPFGTGSFG